MTAQRLAGLDAVTVDYGRGPVLGPVDLSLAPGEIVSLVGPSGCGKSTALRLLAGLETPRSGAVMREVSRGETALVFQAPTLMPWASARANVTLPLELAGVSRKVAARRAEAALSRVRLSAVGDLKPAQLSGGMAMRVALARALVTDPRLLLMDEPFAALDEITRRDLAADIHRIWADTRPTIVFVTHSVAEAVFMAHRVVVLGTCPGRVAGEFEVAASLPREPDFIGSAGFQKVSAAVSAALAQAMLAPA